MNLLDVIKKIIEDLVSVKMVRPIPETTPTPTPTPTPKPDILRAIKMGFEEYGNPPVATLSSTFKEEAEKYNLDPYLLPAVSIVETSGGKNETYPNNPLNWGIRQPSFKPKTPMETIEKAASGIAFRMPYYEKYRQTGNLRDFVEAYAPSRENNVERYLKDLQDYIEMFKKYEK